MKRSVVYGLAGAFVVLSLTSCLGVGLGPEADPPSVAVGGPFDLYIDTNLEADLSYDFGPVDPDGPGKTVTVTIENVSSDSREITEASSDDPHFSLQAPPLPLTLAPGASVDASLTFDPSGSGTEAATVSVTIGGLDEPLQISVTGEGNYPPVARAVVVVSGAGHLPVNGTYYRTGTFNEYDGGGYNPDPQLNYPIPLYEHSSGTYVIFGQRYSVSFGDGFFRYLLWLIDDDQIDFDTDEEYIYGGATVNGFIPPSLPSDDLWAPFSRTDAPKPTVTTELGSAVGDTLTVVSATQLTATYEYTDAEGDAEGATAFQWYRAPLPTTPSGSRTAIPGATGATYTPVSADNGSHLFVRVTPVAGSSTLTGEPIWLGPSAAVTIE